MTEGLSVGLRVNFTAKSDKVQDVRDFLVVRRITSLIQCLF